MLHHLINFILFIQYLSLLFFYIISRFFMKQILLTRLYFQLQYIHNYNIFIFALHTMSSNPSIPKSPPQSQQQQNIQQFNKFLQKNDQILQEKYKQYFIHNTIKITYKDPPPDRVVKFISDVFSFDKSYSEDGGIHRQEEIQASLKNSYQTFLKVNSHVKEFNAHIAIQLLRYCIQSNQMFAVQYESSKQSPSLQEIKQKNQSSPKNKLKSHPHEAHNNEMKKIQQSNPEDNIQQSSQRNSRSNGSNEFGINQGNNSQASHPVKYKNTFDDGELENQFNFHEEIKVDLDPMLVKKNLKIIFQYYCKQQMALAPNLSFDRIEKQSHMMTISKLLLMARMMNMINSVITKQMMISKFRKISEGKKQIDYKKFDILMSQIQVEDPTIIARAQLNSPNIQIYLRTTKKPFDTQDMLPRQMIKNRAFQKKLTAHSGKLSSDLVQDLRIKKQSCILDDRSSPKQSKIKQYYLQISKMNQRYQKQAERQKQVKNQYIKRKESEVINPKNLSKIQRNYSHDLSLIKIKKIIPFEQEDDKWLGQYKINSSIRKAQEFDQNLAKRRSFEGKQRNASLIRDLKNRIKQIQKKQNQTNGMEQTKPYLSSSPSRRY